MKLVIIEAMAAVLLVLGAFSLVITFYPFLNPSKYASVTQMIKGGFYRGA